MTRAKAMILLSVLLMHKGLVSVIRQESFFGRSRSVERLKLSRSLGEFRRSLA